MNLLNKKNEMKSKVPLRIQFIILSDGISWVFVFVPLVATSVVHGMKDGILGVVSGGIAGLITTVLLACQKVWGSRHYWEVYVWNKRKMGGE